MSDSHGSHHGEGEEIWSMDQDGVWQPQSQFDWDEWVEMDSDDDGPMDVDGQGWTGDEQAISPPIDVRPSSPLIPSTTIYTDSNAGLGLPQTHDGADSSVHQPVRPPSPDVPKDVFDDTGVINDDSEHFGPRWKRFDILPSVPHDHAFYTSSPAQPSKSFLARLTREYRVLESSLPGPCLLHRDFISLTALLQNPSLSAHMRTEETYYGPLSLALKTLLTRMPHS